MITVVTGVLRTFFQVLCCLFHQADRHTAMAIGNSRAERSKVFFFWVTYITVKFTVGRV